MSFLCLQKLTSWGKGGTRALSSLKTEFFSLRKGNVHSLWILRTKTGHVIWIIPCSFFPHSLTYFLLGRKKKEERKRKCRSSLALQPLPGSQLHCCRLSFDTDNSFVNCSFQPSCCPSDGRASGPAVKSPPPFGFVWHSVTKRPSGTCQESERIGERQQPGSF